MLSDLEAAAPQTIANRGALPMTNDHLHPSFQHLQMAAPGLPNIQMPSFQRPVGSENFVARQIDQNGPQQKQAPSYDHRFAQTFQPAQALNISAENVHGLQAFQRAQNLQHGTQTSSLTSPAPSQTQTQTTSHQTGQSEKGSANSHMSGPEDATRQKTTPVSPSHHYLLHRLHPGRLGQISLCFNLGRLDLK